jgi:hypothetical protein
MMQVLGHGADDPIKAIICWFDPIVPGGTGWAVRLAEQRKIPVLNLFEDKMWERCVAFLERAGAQSS